MRQGIVLLAVAVVGAAFAAACAPARVRLPGGPWTASPDALSHFGEATRVCSSVRTLAAEVAVSGRAGGTRLRGRLIAGLERPGSVRIEAPAPFGAPVFVLAARGDRAVLYFPRDERVLDEASVAEVLDALAGIRRHAADLHALLSGCLVAARQPSDGRIAAGGWARVELGGGVSAFLRLRGGRWILVGGQSAGDGGPSWAVEYSDVVGGLPRTIRFERGDPGFEPEVTLTLRLSQLETNRPIDTAAFELTVPPGTPRLTLDELRQTGPLADVRREPR